MLAVQAKYENGAVHWKQEPPIKGMHDLIVIFADIPDQEPANAPGSLLSDKNVNRVQEEHKDWSAFSLSNLESAYSDDEPDYSDFMLKETNPDFVL